VQLGVARVGAVAVPAAPEWVRDRREVRQGGRPGGHGLGLLRLLAVLAAGGSVPPNDAGGRAGAGGTGAATGSDRTATGVIGVGGRVTAGAGGAAGPATLRHWSSSARPPAGHPARRALKSRHKYALHDRPSLGRIHIAGIPAFPSYFGPLRTARLFLCPDRAISHAQRPVNPQG